MACTPDRGVRGIVVAGALALVAAVAWALPGSETGVVSSNGIAAAEPVGPLERNRTACDTVPFDVRTADRIQVSFPDGQMGLDLVLVGVLRGRNPEVPAFAAGQSVEYRVTEPVAAFCLTNRGPDPVMLLGQNIPGAVVSGVVAGWRPAIAVIDDGSGTRLGNAADVLHDIGNSRGGAGGALTGWLVVLLALGAVVVALGGAWRHLR